MIKLEMKNIVTDMKNAFDGSFRFSGRKSEFQMSLEIM